MDELAPAPDRGLPLASRQLEAHGWVERGDALLPGTRALPAGDPGAASIRPYSVGASGLSHLVRSHPVPSRPRPRVADADNAHRADDRLASGGGVVDRGASACRRPGL